MGESYMSSVSMTSPGIDLFASTASALVHCCEVPSIEAARDRQESCCALNSSIPGRHCTSVQMRKVS
jgi:hypothetical protein